MVVPDHTLIFWYFFLLVWTNSNKDIVYVNLVLVLETMLVYIDSVNIL